MIRFFGSMFLDRPTQAARFTGQLIRMMGSEIFNQNHQPNIYYAAAYAGYRLDFFFRKNRNNDQNKLLKEYKPLKFHILMVSKYLIENKIVRNFSKSKKTDQYVQKILRILQDDDKCLKLFEDSIEKIKQFSKDNPEYDLSEKDLNKRQKFTEDLIVWLNPAS